jgi:oligoendopeptidase F
MMKGQFMFDTLPNSIEAFSTWEWDRIEPYFDELAGRELTPANVENFLLDWTRLASLVVESGERLQVATTLDTTDTAAEERLNHYLDTIAEPFASQSQRLKEHLLASGLEPSGFTMPLKQIRTDAALFREANIPLETEDQKLGNEYDRIAGAQTVEWEGEEKTISQLRPLLHHNDRSVRERVWKAIAARQLQDREAFNALWQKLLELRIKMAQNAGYDNYRDFRWLQMSRFDYTSDDILRFHDAIEQVVVPAAQRIYERHRQQLGVDTLRPWDTDVDPLGRPALHPYQTVEELNAGTMRIFNAVDPQFGVYYQDMLDNRLLDLENRKGKAPGGYCTGFAHSRQTFIFMNAVGLHDDVQTLLHEGGHAFHAYESNPLPYIQQREDVPIEFAEVASMTMELLGQPYLAQPIGFYSEADAARATIEHLEGLITFWPYMAVVDAFQHWVYTHEADAMNPANCDAKWSELWDRFMKGQDWSGLEEEKATGWHRKLHIFQIPFYYVEYGLAQLGAVQVWRNSLQDERKAIADYRHALSLGNTKPLPELFQTAGAQLTPDVATLGACVDLVEATIARLEAN